MSGEGHNSGAVHQVTRNQLRAFVERIENLEEEGRSINDDKRDVYAEAKATGFDPKIIKRVVAIRRVPKDRRDEEEAILQTYLQALGLASSEEE